MKSDRINELKEKYTSSILSILHSKNQDLDSIQKNSSLDKELTRIEVSEEEKRRKSDGKSFSWHTTSRSLVCSSEIIKAIIRFNEIKLS